MLTLILVVAVLIILICLICSMDGDGNWVFLGFCFVFVVMFFTVLKYEEFRTEDCESKLPRNQECRLIAVPVEVKETVVSTTQEGK